MKLFTRTPVCASVVMPFDVSKRTQVSNVILEFRHPRAGTSRHHFFPDARTDAVFIGPGEWVLVLERRPHRIIWWRRALAWLDRMLAWVVGTKEEKKP